MESVAREPVRAPITAGEVPLGTFSAADWVVDWKRCCWRGRTFIERGVGRRTARAAKLAFEAIRLWNIVYVQSLRDSSCAGCWSLQEWFVSRRIGREEME